METLSTVPAIILRSGAEWYAGLGTPKNGGTRLYLHLAATSTARAFTNCPWVSRCAGMIEEVAGGVLDGKKLKAVIPGGSSCPLLTADEIDVAMDYDSVAKIGSMLGSGGMVIMDEDTCMVDLARPHHALLRARILRLVHSLPRRHGVAAQDARPLPRWRRTRGRHSADRRAFAEYARAARSARWATPRRMPTISIVKKWRNEFEEHLHGKCAYKHAVIVAATH